MPTSSVISGSGTAQVDVVQSIHSLRDLIPEWREFLAEGVCGANFYNDPAHIALHLEGEPQQSPLVIVIRQDGRIRCIAPFYLGNDRRQIQFSVITLAKLRARLLTLFGADIIVAAGEDQTTYYAAVFRTLAEYSSDYDLILFEHLDMSAPLYEFCHARLTRGQKFRIFTASSRTDTVYQIVFPNTHDELMHSLSYDTRRKFRRYSRQLCRSEQARLERITDCRQVPGFLNTLDDIFRQCWQNDHYGYRPRNTPSDIRKLEDLARHGWLRSYLLLNDGRPFAFALGYQYDGTFYFEETGYVQAEARYSPGVVLMHMFIEDMYRDHAPKMLDFGHGRHAYKRSLSNVQHEVASLYITPANRWRRIMSIQEFLFAMERVVGSTVSHLKLDRFLRKLLHRLGADVGRYG